MSTVCHGKTCGQGASLSCAQAHDCQIGFEMVFATIIGGRPAATHGRCAIEIGTPVHASAAAARSAIERTADRMDVDGS